MLVLNHLLHVLFTLRGVFMHFPELTYWRDAIVQLPCFPQFCVSEKLHRKYSWNWTKQRPKLLFFPDKGRRPNESRRGARGKPHPRVARRPPGRATRGWGPLVHLLTTPLRLYKVSQRKPLKWSAIFQKKSCSSAATTDEFRGTEVSVLAPCRDGEVPPEPSPSTSSPPPLSPSTSPPSPPMLLSPMMRRE
jgi:hypothetical protein